MLTNIENYWEVLDTCLNKTKSLKRRDKIKKSESKVDLKLIVNL